MDEMKNKHDSDHEGCANLEKGPDARPPDTPSEDQLATPIPLLTVEVSPEPHTVVANEDSTPDRTPSVPMSHFEPVVSAQTPESDATPTFIERVEARLPQRFVLNEAGNQIMQLRDKHSPLPVCDPCYVERMERGRAGKPARIIIVFLNNQGIETEVSILASDIGRPSPTGVQDLRSFGLRIFVRDSVFADLLRSSSYEVVDPCSVHPGWFSREPLLFGLTDGQYIATDAGADEVNVAAPRWQYQTEELEKWTKTVGALLCCNPYAILMICIALVGPLLAFIRWGSFIVNFAVRTSNAKTTLLGIGGHIWGTTTMHGWTISRPALDDACLGADGTFLAFDEVPDGGIAKTVGTVFAICNGMRHGARPAPGQKAQESVWRVAAAATSERPFFEQALADARKGRGNAFDAKPAVKAGAFVRIIDVAGSDAEVWENLHGFATKGAFLRQLEMASETSAGVVGPAFVSAVIKKGPKLTEGLAELHIAFKNQIATDLGFDPVTAEGEFMRVAGHFAAIRLAGQLAVSLKILPWDRREVTKAVAVAAHSWARIRKVGKYHVEEDPITTIRNFVLPRLDTALREVDPDRRPIGKMPRAQAGWYNDNYYYLRPDTMRGFVRKGAAPNEVKSLLADLCHKLEDRGALIRGGEKDTFGVRMSSLIERGIRVYMLSRVVIDGAEEEF